MSCYKTFGCEICFNPMTEGVTLHMNSKDGKYTIISSYSSLVDITIRQNEQVRHIYENCRVEINKAKAKGDL